MDIVIKGIEGITEQEVLEWVAILFERKENAKLNQIQAVSEAVKTTQTNIDTFRELNALTPKYKAVEDDKADPSIQ